MPKAHILKNLSRLWRCSKGVTAIEYALIAGTVAAVIIFTVATVGKQLDTSFKNTATELSGMPGTSGGGGSGGGTSDSDGDSGGSGGGSGGGTSDNDGGSGGGGTASNDDDDDDDDRGGGRGRGRGR